MADASSSSSSQHKYDVFLSFRGEDTRNNFTAHLYHALCHKGIYTFIDDDKLARGQVISPALVTAIENSMFSIIVLSENYASSRWCLEELVKILECKENKGQTVLPIFYHVDPSDVRKQRGKFGEALAKHEENMKENVERVKIWKDALTKVADLSGWDSRNKNEFLLIKEVAENIWNKLPSTLTSDTEDLVGIDSHIQEVEMLLCLEADDVRMVGIWGMGGIGKTTLARAIFKKISDKFEGCCFLDDVADLARKGKDLKKLLLSDVLRDKNIDVTAPSLKARLHFKKVLIVIDNVNNRAILENLVGEPNWFGPKSRIIITTRDAHLLVAYGVNDVYEVQKLQDEQATKLFNQYAFRNDTPSRDVMKLIDLVIAYAQGLPLALKVLGSSLCKKSIDEWLCELIKLQKIPNMENQNVLQTSFDELDYYQQNLFLDIAFSFRGESKDVVIDILNSCGFFPISGIRTLIDKSLISCIDERLYMHDLLKEMGKEIVRRTFPEEPGKRSRLWMQQDVCHVLENLTGTEKVEVINFTLSGLKEIQFTTAAFAKMTKLRVLIINKPQMQCEVLISDDFKFHYDELRYLAWYDYPLKLLPSDFECKNLVSFRMPNSHLTQLWEGNKVWLIYSLFFRGWGRGNNMLCA
ncbi:hypothetical protein PVL29_024913 [Vitis rotundifolia]|uniref:TIR domain-containing protein n=1 Tax=Vitis rotundifolia TaxID=103349 RepID=A0AA38YT12_VITRO|nr:hypothetical protein PVL29_024913 [Vitis rotundifolia]